MIIRRAEEKDIDVIKKLLRQVLEIHHKGRPDIFKTGVMKYTHEELKSIILNDLTPIFVAEDNSIVCAYSFCMLEERVGDNILNDSHELYIDDICVDESARGRGIGKMLLNYVKVYAKEMGCTSITLNVWELNSPAKSFYLKEGFAPQKTVMELKI